MKCPRGEQLVLGDAVAPLAGAWIEIVQAASAACCKASPPSRGRGLKYLVQAWISANNVVAPLAGAWIEMNTRGHMMSLRPCRPPRGGVD